MDTVCRSFELLIERADEHGGVFPSVLDWFSGLFLRLIELFVRLPHYR
jgi:hypothetical protein